MNPRLLLLLAVLSLCSAAHAQPVCPWLTEGTAATLLGGPVTVTAKILLSGEGTCTFTLQQSTTPSRLEITVAASPHQDCPSNSKPLVGIGNEALTCSVTPSPNQTIDIVTARVRSLYFVIRLTAPTRTAPAASPNGLQSLVAQAAEQVAGNLY